MTVVTNERQASSLEIIAEMDRRGRVIEELEAKIAALTPNAQPVASRSSVSTDAVGVETWVPNKDYGREATYPPVGHPLSGLFHNARLMWPHNMDSRAQYERIVDWLAALRSAPPQQEAGPEDVKDKAWWLSVAKAAGEHGVRYRTNLTLLAFLDAIPGIHPSPAPLADERHYTDEDYRRLHEAHCLTNARAEAAEAKLAALRHSLDHKRFVGMMTGPNPAEVWEAQAVRLAHELDAAEAKLAALAQPSPEGRQAEEVEPAVQSDMDWLREQITWEREAGNYSHAGALQRICDRLSNAVEAARAALSEPTT